MQAVDEGEVEPDIEYGRNYEKDERGFTVAESRAYAATEIVDEHERQRADEDIEIIYTVGIVRAVNAERI